MNFILHKTFKTLSDPSPSSPAARFCLLHKRGRFLAHCPTLSFPPANKKNIKRGQFRHYYVHFSSWDLACWFFFLFLGLSEIMSRLSSYGGLIWHNFAKKTRKSSFLEQKREQNGGNGQRRDRRYIEKKAPFNRFVQKLVGSLKNIFIVVRQFLDY